MGNVDTWNGNPACASNLWRVGGNIQNPIIEVPCAASGRYLFVVKPSATNNLDLHEVVVRGPGCEPCKAGTFLSDGGLSELKRRGRFLTLALNPPRLATMFSHNAPPVTETTGMLGMPTYDPQAGPRGKGAVVFGSSNTGTIDGTNLMPSSPGALRVDTFGGVTMVAVVRFEGSVVSYERTFCCNPNNLDNFWYGRYSNGKTLLVNYRSDYSGGDAQCDLTFPNVIEQNQWMTIISRYDRASRTLEIEVEGYGTVRKTCTAGTTSTHNGIRDRTYPHPDGAEFCGLTHRGTVAGFLLVDEYLSRATADAIVDAMKNGEDLTAPATCQPRCGSGYYSEEVGATTFFSSKMCNQCPEHSTAPIGSSSASNCTCLEGYYGPAGGPCEPCPSGTYKSSIGSAAACTPCPRSGQWSPKASNHEENCVFKASGFAVIDYHGNLLYNVTEEFVSFDANGNQHWTMVPMHGEGTWQERWNQHQDRVEGWDTRFREETKSRREHLRAEEGPRQSMREQRDADLGKPRPYKNWIQPHQVASVLLLSRARERLALSRLFASPPLSCARADMVVSNLDGGVFPSGRPRHGCEEEGRGGEEKGRGRAEEGREKSKTRRRSPAPRRTKSRLMVGG